MLCSTNRKKENAQQENGYVVSNVKHFLLFFPSSNILQYQGNNLCTRCLLGSSGETGGCSFLVFGEGGRE